MATPGPSAQDLSTAKPDVNRPTLQELISGVEHEGSIGAREKELALGLGLVVYFFDIVREPVRGAYQHIRAIQDLKKRIGQWEAQAYDGNGDIQIPFLKKPLFQSHLEKKDGRFVPAGKCTESSSWARLLHALAITPDMKPAVLDWRYPTEGFIYTQKGGIEMEVHGEVICHLINLFGQSPDPSFREMVVCGAEQREWHKPFEISFGRFWIRTIDGKVHAHFQGGGNADMDAPKEPFGKLGQGLKDLYTWYDFTLGLGASEAELAWPDPKTNQLERAEALVSHLKAVQSRWKPLLLTHEWLEDASRIKHRVCHAWGQNLCEDVVKVVERHPQLDEADRMNLSRDVRSCFFVNEEDSFYFVVGRDNSSAPSYLSGASLQEVFATTLESYKAMPSGTWQRKSVDRIEQLLDVLFLHRAVRLGAHVRVLDFTPQSALWSEKTVLLG